MNLIVQWNKVAQQGLQALAQLPFADAGQANHVAHSIGVIFTAGYDAWAAYDDIATPLHSATPRRPVSQRSDRNRRKAVSQAMARAILNQLPPFIFEPPFQASFVSSIDALLQAEGVTPDDRSTHPDNPVGVGNLAANAVLAVHCLDDSAARAAFCVDASDGKPARPAPNGIGGQGAGGASSEWSLGRWCEFAAFVAERDQLDLNESMALFFAVANGFFDANIVTWDAKRRFDYVRPVTAIRQLFEGRVGGERAGLGKGQPSTAAQRVERCQAPSAATTPFFDLHSERSGFSMAAAALLKRFTGSERSGYFYTQDVPLKTDPLEPVTDIVLSWPRFSAAIRQAGDSPLHGEIHFHDSSPADLDMGQRVVELAFARAQTLWSGA